MAVLLTEPPLVEQARHRQLPEPARARAIRVAANVTQAEIARELGVHTVTVQRWESGSRRPRGATASAYGALLAALAEVVG